MIINDSIRLNETKVIKINNTTSAYQYNGKYYLKVNNTKKEITKDQYAKLLNKAELIKKSNDPSSISPNEISYLRDSGRVFKLTRGKPMSHKEADSGKANPHYDPKSRSYSENCQSCVYAYEMRLRGYDVQAKGWDSRNKDQVDLAKFMSLGWVDEKGKKPNSHKPAIKDAAGVESFLDTKIKPNERYFLSVNWDDGGAHIVTISKNKNNKLSIYDPQLNKTYTGKDLKSEYFDILQYNGYPIEIMRVDNLRPNPQYASGVLKVNKE